MKEKRKLFYISTIGLYLFAVFGQWVCGLAYDNQRCLQQREMRLRMLAVIAVCVLCVRLLRGDGRSKRVWRTILGAALSVCMLAAMVYPLLQACNTRDSFAVHPRLIEREGGAHWTGELDWLEEEKKLWKLSHWAGRGEVWYQLDDAVLENAPADADWESEPYRSALEESCRGRYMLYDHGEKLLLNLTNYLLGRWIWLAYLLLALLWTGSGMTLFAEKKSRGETLLLSLAFLLPALRIWLPTLDCCGLVYSCVGPLFSCAQGDAPTQLCAVAPAFGFLIGLTLSEKEKELLTRMTVWLKKTI